MMREAIVPSSFFGQYLGSNLWMALLVLLLLGMMLQVDGGA